MSATPSPDFPVHLLRPMLGRLEGHLFENPSVGVERAVYYSVVVPFEPIQYGDDLVETAASVEWLRLQVRDWRTLVGTIVVSAPGIEASFYLWEHREALDARLEFLSRDGLDMDVRVRFRADLNDRYDLPSPPLSDIDVRARVRYGGILINEAVVKYAPGNKREARSAAEPFVDLARHRDPEFQPYMTGRGGIFVLRPIDER
jgi:hypothetical protein